MVAAVVLSLVQALVLLVAPHGSRASATPAPSATGGLFVADQGKLLDTVAGTGGYSTPMPAGMWRSVAVDGVAGIPSDGVSAVQVNFTVVNPSATGYLHAAKGGVSNPSTTVSYMNFLSGATESNSAIIQVGDNGGIQVQASVSTDMQIVVQGYYTSGATAAGGYVPMTATMLTSKSAAATASTWTFNVAGSGGVPSDASGVMLDIIEGAPASGNGYIIAYPGGTARPATSLHWPSGKNYEWSVPVALAAAGTVSIYVGAAGPVNLQVAIEGYYTATDGSSPSGIFTPGATRVYNSQDPGNTSVASGATRTVSVAGIAHVPAAGSGITAVVANIHVKAGSGSGHLQAFPDNVSPGSSYMQFYANQELSSLITVPLGPDGGIKIQNSSSDAVNIVVDIEGWYSDVASAIAGGQTNTAKDLTLQADGSTGGSWVTYNYRLGTTGPFSNVPTGDVSDSSGQSPAAWPVQKSQGSFTAYTWNLTATLGTAAGLVQVEACLGTSSTDSNPVCTMPTSVNYSPGAFSADGAETGVGPGDVSLVTGDLALSATDATTAAYAGGLSIARTLTTLAPADAGKPGSAQRSDATGIFGPGWTADILPAQSGGDGYVAVADNASASGYVVFGNRANSTITYVATSSTSAYPISFTGVGAAASDGSTVSKVDASTITRRDSDGVTTTWKKANGVWQVQSLAEAGSNTSTTYTYNASGLPTRVLAPVPPGVSCDTAPDDTPGCRSFILEYEQVSASGSTVSRLQDVKLSAPSGANVPNIVSVAAYDYTSNGMLADTYDPRISPPLKTSYTYDQNGRLATETEPGISPWSFTYDSGGRLSSASRTDTSGSTAAMTVVYDVALSGAGLPDLSASTSAAWDETTDLPVTGTAVFQPDHTPGSTNPSSVQSGDWPYASIYFMDVNGREVNEAGYGAGSWQIETESYDANGNETWNLTAGNRAQALNPTSSTDPYVAGLPDSYKRADLLASSYSYSSLEPSEQVETFGPTHPVTLSDSSVIDASEHTVTNYDENAPNNDVNPQTGTDYALETSSITTEFNVQTNADSSFPNEIVTRTGYGAIVSGDTDGWSLGVGTTQTAQVASAPSSGDLITTSRYDSAGRVIEQRPPSDATAAGSESTDTSYYSATGTGACVNAAWAGWVCSISPASQPSSGGGLPVTTYTYNSLGEPLTSVDVAVSGASQATRTTRNTYDSAGRLATSGVSISGSTAGSVPSVTFAYNNSNGQLASRSVGTGPSAQSIATTYDALGRVNSYTDASGNVSTFSYDIDGRPASLNDGRGTVTYTWDGANEHRGLLTGEDIGVAGAPSTFTQAYDADGQPTVETYPNGLVATRSYDNTGFASGLAYAKAGAVWLNFTNTESVAGRVATATASIGGTVQSRDAYAYDSAGRLTNVQDNYQGSCITRSYALTANADRTSEIAYTAGTGGACATSGASSTTNYTYDSAGRLTSDSAGAYNYDAYGRATSVPSGDAGGGGALTIAYYDNDMVQSEAQGASSLTFGLDPLQTRIATANDGNHISTNHFSDDSDSPTSVSSDDGSWTRFISDPSGTFAAKAVSDGSVLLQLVNLHSDVVATSADTTAATSISSYADTDEFGVGRASSQPARPYGWLGGDQRSNYALGGVELMGARLYLPSTGRFLSPDSAVDATESSYVYAHADPVNNTDLDGHWWLHWTFAFDVSIHEIMNLVEGQDMKFLREINSWARWISSVIPVGHYVHTIVQLTINIMDFVEQIVEAGVSGHINGIQIVVQIAFGAHHWWQAPHFKLDYVHWHWLYR